MASALINGLQAGLAAGAASQGIPSGATMPGTASPYYQTLMAMNAGRSRGLPGLIGTGMSLAMNPMMQQLQGNTPGQNAQGNAPISTGNQAYNPGPGNQSSGYGYGYSDVMPPVAPSYMLNTSNQMPPLAPSYQTPQTALPYASLNTYNQGQV